MCSSADKRGDLSFCPIISPPRFTYSGNHGIVLSLLFSFFLIVLSPVSAQPTPDPRNDPYQYRFSPSMAVIIVVLVSALFFMAFFSVYIRRCSDSQSAANSVRPLAGTIAGRSRRARGLERSVIETFPTFEYSEVKEHKLGKGALECAVCLNEFEEDETLRLIPKCDHVFHPECIDAWLESHTTCPVCRSNLVPQPGESVHQTTELNTEVDIEAQNDAVDPAAEDSLRGREQQQTLPLSPSQAVEPDALDSSKTLNRNCTRGSRSNRLRWFYPRSYSTGHALVQPGENTERFTLKLPVEVRKQIMTRKLNRAMSMVVLPTEGSSRRGYRIGGGEGSSRGKYYKRLERLDRKVKSDRWVVSMTPPFFMRMSSMKSPKVVTHDGQSSSVTESRPGESSADPSRLPV